jgi:hypothetical protein
MYKGIGEAAYNDGLFSQAAPFQDYQASVSQFGDGALGAVASLVPRGLVRTNERRARHRAISGAGVAYQDGTLGRTFLPAFSPQAMRGLGYAYQDGVLGADGSATIQIGPQPAPAWKPDLASAGIGVMAGALLFYVLKL